MSAEPESSPTGPNLFFDKHPRVFGVVLLAIAMIFALWAFYFPIHDALAGAPKVTLYPKAIFACVMLAIFAVAFFILGPHTYTLALKFVALRGWKKWLTIAAIIIPLILIAEQVKHILEGFLQGFGFRP